MKAWICRECEHEVYSNTKPDPIKWTDGHVCCFVENPEAFVELAGKEAGSG